MLGVGEEDSSSVCDAIGEGLGCALAEDDMLSGGGARPSIAVSLKGMTQSGVECL